MNSIVVCCLLALGCQSLRFANQDLRSRSVKIFIGAVHDTSTHGGQSSRVSKAVRELLFTEGRVSIVSKNDAEYFLALQLLKSTRSPTAVLDCVRLGEGDVIAAGAFSCASVKGSVVRPDVSVESERLSLDFRATLTQAATGKIVWQKSYPALASDYAVVGSDTTKQDLALTPELHTLRYFENSDEAAVRIGRNLASQLIPEIRNLP